MKKSNQGIITDIIQKRINNKNQNLIGLFVGATGTGKSYSCLRLGEKLDPNFTSKNIIFSVDELIEKLHNKEIKKGSVLVFEEIGVGADSRNFYTKQNKNLGYVLATFRTLNSVILFNTPAQSMIDKKVRQVTHIIFEMIGIDYQTKRAFCKPKWIQHNGLLGKDFPKYTKKGNFKIKQARFKLPSQKLIDIYEKKRQSFLDNVIFKAKNQIEEESKPKQTKKLNIKKDVSDKIKELGGVPQFLEKVKKKNKLDINYISIIFECGRTMAYSYKAYIEMMYN